MANEEQLERLWASVKEQNGCAAWNQWRQEDHWRTQIDLRGAHLSRIHLTADDFSRIRLRRADLSGIGLSYDDFSGIDLSYADLTGADLKSTHLSYADFRGAVLTGAHFTNVKFYRTQIAAALVDTQTFAGMDLTGLIGLGLVRYSDSAPKLPLPAVGSSVTGTSTPLPGFLSIKSIFMSYARVDNSFVDTLEKRLQSTGYTTWVDRGQLQGGQQWLRQIQDAIDACTVMLVVLSPEAVESAYVESEYHYAQQGKKVIIPLDYRVCKVPMLLSRLQVIDFRTVSYEQSVQYLLNALRHYINE